MFILASGYVHQRPDRCPTALSRLDMLHALAAGRINIDIYKNTRDVAEFEGHYYSDKAPGTVLLALPAFAASAAVLRLYDIPLDSKPGWLATSWLSCVGSIGIMAALGSGVLFSWLSKWCRPKPALVTTVTIFLGAAPLPYATMMFSHALVVGLLAMALWSAGKQNELLGKGGPDTDERSKFCISLWLRGNRWALLAGFGCGWALASEYTAGLVVAGIFSWLGSRRLTCILPFCIAALPPLLLIPLYSYACFGRPFVLPYSVNPSFPEMKEGLFAIKWPDSETAYNLLFSPTRGLFFWTPFLLVATAGYWKLIQENRSLFWLTYVVPLLQVAVISGRKWDWPAGPTLGPRYLAPILPLMALPCALGLIEFPRIGVFLAAYSVLVTTLATLANAAPPYSFYNPLVDFHIPILLKGDLSPNLGMVLGLPSHVSIGLYYCVLICVFALLWRRSPGQMQHEP